VLCQANEEAEEIDHFLGRFANDLALFSEVFKVTRVFSILFSVWKQTLPHRRQASFSLLSK